MTRFKEKLSWLVLLVLAVCALLAQAAEAGCLNN